VWHGGASILKMDKLLKKLEKKIEKKTMDPAERKRRGQEMHKKQTARHEQKVRAKEIIETSEQKDFNPDITSRFSSNAAILEKAGGGARKFGLQTKEDRLRAKEEEEATAAAEAEAREAAEAAAREKAEEDLEREKRREEKRLRKEARREEKEREREERREEKRRKPKEAEDDD